jgi:hypothetical protein
MERYRSYWMAATLVFLGLAFVRVYRKPIEEACASGSSCPPNAGRRFLGSPSIRVNGADIEPGREADSPFFGCRTYTVAGKTVGVPPERWLVEALRRGV